MTAGSIRFFFKDFGYKVIRLKYFIMIVGALVLEIATLTLYLLKLQNIVEFQLFNLSILYGAISGIIVVVAIGILVLMKVDRKKDAEKIRKFRDYQRKYNFLCAKHTDSINGLLSSFENETKNLDLKLEYSESLEKRYNCFLEELEGLEVPDFLALAHHYECDHLAREKQFYSGFSSLMPPQELKSISNQSDTSHSNFLREMHGIEKSLKLII